MNATYFKTRSGVVYEMTATTKAGVYAWFRRIDGWDDELLPIKGMKPMTDSEVMAMARTVAA